MSVRRLVAWHEQLTSDLFTTLVDLHRLPCALPGTGSDVLLDVCDTMGLWVLGCCRWF